MATYRIQRLFSSENNGYTKGEIAALGLGSGLALIPLIPAAKLALSKDGKTVSEKILKSRAEDKALKRAQISGIIGAGINAATLQKRHNRLKREETFSKRLPSDWDSDDDDYVRMVENAKSRNRKIASAGPYLLPTIYGTLGAAAGGISGGVTGAAIGATAGAGGAWLAQEAIGAHLRSKGIRNRGTTKEAFQNLSRSDQKSADRALAKYRNMKTKKERLAWRKKIGSRV